MNRAIVILYKGDDLSQYTIQDIIETLCIKHAACDPHDVTYINFSEDEIAKVLAKKIIAEQELSNEEKIDNNKEPEDLKNAIVYLAGSVNLKYFDTKILNEVFRDYVGEYFNNSTNKPLSAAIEILYKYSRNSCDKICKKYNINSAMIAKIRNMYKEKSSIPWL